ncbi:F/Y-rich N-terminus-domain-containing protein, partial [Trametes punicea]
DELEHEDPDIDPHLLSRHIGPAARRRQEAEERERQEEEAREAKRTTRKPRGPQKGKDMGAPLTFAPVPLPGPPSSAPQGNPTLSPPILVSSTGTRLRLKPPAPPGSDAPPSSSSVPHSGGGSHGNPHARQRSESLSPVLSPQDEYMPGVHPDTVSSPYQHGVPPPQSQMQMTLRASSTNSRPSDIQRHTKPKRLKAHTVTTRSYSIPTVPRDKRGKPILPLNVGIMTVHNLGEVCMREHFHTERYIFPVGYEVTRRYLSTIDPNAEVVYHCKILDGGDGPKFQITASDMPDKPIVAGTATGAWSVIVRAANHIRNRAHSNSVSGPDFFGLGQNTIKHLIQELPHANQLKDYVWQHFVEGG